jgi:hypothetical protein
MLDERNYGGREHSEERKDQHNMENTEAPHTHSQQCLHDTTATLTADPLCRTDSLLESKQPHGNTQEGETGAMRIWFALKETNQRQPMVYGRHSESITGNKAVPLIVLLLLHLFTLYECMTTCCPFNSFTLQPDYLQFRNNPGKNPTTLPSTHNMADLEVFW